MRTSQTGRLLAPLALVGCVLAVVLVAMTTLGGDESPTRTASATQEKSSATGRTSTTQKRTTYTVTSGDSLSIIAEKTGVPVEELVQLNPGVDPQSLRTGQKLKLRSS
jgi:LysM repeat protein